MARGNRFLGSRITCKAEHHIEDARAPWTPRTGGRARTRLRQSSAGATADPFGVLGPHAVPEGLVVRAFLPGAAAVSVLAHDASQTLALRPPR